MPGRTWSLNTRQKCSIGRCTAPCDICNANGQWRCYRPHLVERELLGMMVFVVGDIDQGRIRTATQAINQSEGLCLNKHPQFF